MVTDNTHTVGAEISGIRVPENHVDALTEIANLLPQDEALRRQVLGRLASHLTQIDTIGKVSDEVHDRGVLNSDRANFEKRYQPDYEKIRVICNAMRELGHKVVLTSGTFDIIHIGHAQYLQVASLYGDFLVVGVDSDEKVRAKKGPTRPIVPEEERLKMLAHLRGVGLVTLKEIDSPRWHLIKTVHPDTLIATEGSYSEEEVAELEEFNVGRVVVLPPQATTSTTARLRLVQVAHGEGIREKIDSELHQSPLDEPTKNELRKIVEKILS